MNVCAYTSVCEEDRTWIPQYLAEVERIGVWFCIHLDRCRPETKKYLVDHPACRGYTESRSDCKEFSESHKQGAMDLAARSGADWAMAWDIDETWEPEFRDKIRLLDSSSMDYVKCPWLNLWGDVEHVRVDGPFEGGYRVKFYNLKKGFIYKFTHHVINGPKCVNSSLTECTDLPIICIHHGMMTHELRVQHKERWDRIYTSWVGSNPYGIWNYSLSYEDYPPSVCLLEERLRVWRV